MHIILFICTFFGESVPEPELSILRELIFSSIGS